MHDTSSNQAVVLGASMAGLLAARVLAERFEQVVVIERDVLQPVGEHRRGVPHGRHLHGLHPRGREILEELFPGFTATLTASGAVPLRCPRGPALAAVRPPAAAGEHRLASPARQPAVPRRPCPGDGPELPGVRFLEEHSVCGLTVTADKRQVTGVEVHGTRGGHQYRSRPAWWWTPPGEAHAPRSGWPSWATSAQRRSGSRSAWATRRGTTGCGAAR